MSGLVSLFNDAIKQHFREEAPLQLSHITNDLPPMESDNPLEDKLKTAFHKTKSIYNSTIPYVISTTIAAATAYRLYHFHSQVFNIPFLGGYDTIPLTSYACGLAGHITNYIPFVPSSIPNMLLQASSHTANLGIIDTIAFASILNLTFTTLSFINAKAKNFSVAKLQEEIVTQGKALDELAIEANTLIKKISDQGNSIEENRVLREQATLLGARIDHLEGIGRNILVRQFNVNQDTTLSTEYRKKVDRALTKLQNYYPTYISLMKIYIDMIRTEDQKERSELYYRSLPIKTRLLDIREDVRESIEASNTTLLKDVQKKERNRLLNQVKRLLPNYLTSKIDTFWHYEGVITRLALDAFIGINLYQMTSLSVSIPIALTLAPRYAPRIWKDLKDLHPFATRTTQAVAAITPKLPQPLARLTGYPAPLALPAPQPALAQHVAAPANPLANQATNLLDSLFNVLDLVAPQHRT